MKTIALLAFAAAATAGPAAALSITISDLDTGESESITTSRSSLSHDTTVGEWTVSLSASSLAGFPSPFFSLNLAATNSQLPGGFNPEASGLQIMMSDTDYGLVSGDTMQIGFDGFGEISTPEVDDFYDGPPLGELVIGDWAGRNNALFEMSAVSWSSFAEFPYQFFPGDPTSWTHNVDYQVPGDVIGGLAAPFSYTRLIRVTHFGDQRESWLQTSAFERVAHVPLPGSSALVLSGMLALAGCRLRRR